MIISLGIIALLLVIAYQDITSRAVSIIIFPLLLGTFLWERFSKEPALQIAEDWGINLLFVMLLMTSISLYFFVRYRKNLTFIREALGLGDILFWIVVSSYFSFLNFSFFLF